MDNKYCIIENDGVALCVCKHRPCEQIAELKDKITGLEKNRDDLVNDLSVADKGKQALIEIKEIASKFDYWSNNLTDASNILWEIRDKIDEVLNA